MVTKTTTEAGHFHAVKFYESPESLCRIVAEFLGEGLVGQHPVLVIATPDHRDGITAELRARHFDVAAMQEAGDLLMVDAEETLQAFMIDGMPDEERFTVSVGAKLDQVSRGRRGHAVRAYGEMVDVLWRNNQQVAAIKLEMLWNKLAKDHHFELLCGYAMGSFYKDANLSDIHREHSHVVVGDLTPESGGTTH